MSDGTELIRLNSRTKKATNALIDFSPIDFRLGHATVDDSAAIRNWDLGSVNGTRLGVAGSKLAFYGGVPIVKPSGNLFTVLTNLGLVTTPSLQFSNLTGTATAGQIPALDWSKITTGKPTTIAGYGITDLNSLGDARWPQLSGSYVNPSWISSLPFSKLTGTPTTIAGYGITDLNSLGDARWPQLSGSYANPSWITSVPFSKLTGTPTTIAGYGITDLNSLGDARWPQLSGSYANPAWITSLPFSKLTGTPTTLAGYGITDNTFANLLSKPTTLAGYGITDQIALKDAANTFVPLQTFNSLNTYAATATPLADPGAPSIANIGTPGATTWRYRIVAKLADGVTVTAAGTTGTTTTGNATLDATNKNSLTWAAVPGAASYDVYRTVAGLVPSSVGKIANVTSPAYVDAGAAGDSSIAPLVNTTGSINAVDGIYGRNVSIAGTTTSVGAITGPINPRTGSILDYVDVRWYGVDVTGGTDSTTAFNNARAAARAAKAVLYIPGIVKVTSTLTVTAPETWSGGTILWGGASGGTVIIFSSIETLAAAGGLQNMVIDGGGIAANGVIIQDSQFLTFRNFEIKGFTSGTGLKIIGGTLNADFNDISDGVINGSGAGNSCLWLSGTGANACHNTISNLVLTHDSTRPALRLGNCDNNRITGLTILRFGGSAAGVLVDPTEAVNMPDENVFVHLQAGLGGWVQPAGTVLSPAAIYGYSTHNGQPNPVTNGTPLSPVVYSSGYGQFSALTIATTIDLTGDLTGRGALISKHGATSTINGFDVRTSDFDTSFKLAGYYVGGPTAPGNIPGSVTPWANAAGLYFQNLDNVLFTSNNAVSFRFVSPSVVFTGSISPASITQEAVAAPFLVNGWSNFGSGYGNAGYYKDREGRVWLSGVIGGGTATVGTTLFTLPSGYRPPASRIYGVNSAGTYGQIQITPSGLVQIFVGNTSDLCLDGVSFRTD